MNELSAFADTQTHVCGRPSSSSKSSLCRLVAKIPLRNRPFGSKPGSKAGTVSSRKATTPSDDGEKNSFAFFFAGKALIKKA